VLLLLLLQGQLGDLRGFLQDINIQQSQSDWILEASASKINEYRSLADAKAYYASKQLDYCSRIVFSLLSEQI